MSVDWAKLGKTWRVRYKMVSPSDLNSTLGELEGVVPSTASITESYYGDTRVQAKLSFVGDGWVRQSFVRIIAELPDEGYKEELGTFLATSDDASTENGEWTTSLDLESMLYALDQESGVQWTVKEGASALHAIERMLKNCGRDYIDKTANDKVLGKNHVYQADKSFLARVYDLCDRSGNRLDVDGHGRVTVEKYVRPRKKTPSFEIDLKAADGMAHDGVSRSSNYLQIPTDCVVYATKNEDYTTTNAKGKKVTKQRTKYVYGTASNGGRVGRGKRGYVITKVVNETDVEDPTASGMHAKAKEYLANASGESEQYELTCEYMPIHAGDVGILRGLDDPYYPSKQKVLVKERELELEHMTMKLTLKLANDEGDDDE